jgi:hypothetical protein
MAKLWSELKAVELVEYMRDHDYPLHNEKAIVYYGTAAYDWLYLDHHRPMNWILGAIQTACKKLKLPEIQVCFVNQSTKKTGDGCHAKMTRADLAKAVKAKPFPYDKLLQAL